MKIWAGKPAFSRKKFIAGELKRPKFLFKIDALRQSVEITEIVSRILSTNFVKEMVLLDKLLKI